MVHEPPRIIVGQRYVLERLLGQGGMGEVWQAKHLALRARVAIKLLQGALSGDAAMSRRFLTEAQITAQLQTRHAVRVYDFGIADDGRPYLVMELLEGETLQSRLHRHQRLDCASVVQYLSQAARALQRAHDLGIVHRDFKPSNVFLTTDEEEGDVVKVMDFGIAKLLGELEVIPASVRAGFVEPHADTMPAGRASAIATTLTTGTPQLDFKLAPWGRSDTVSRRALETFGRTFALLGTPLYMAPEQVSNAPDLGPAADIWAFGVVAYQCLIGRTPFEAPEASAVFHRINHGIYPRPSEVLPSLPKAFDDWFARACAIDPKARFDGPTTAAAELARALGIAHAPRLRSNPSLQPMPTPRSVWPPSSDLTGTLSVPRVVSRPTLSTSSREPLVLADTNPHLQPRRRSEGLWPLALALAATGLGMMALWQRTPRPPQLSSPSPPMLSVAVSSTLSVADAALPEALDAGYVQPIPSAQAQSPR